MFLIRWISRWPLPLLYRLGAPLGWLVWLLSGTWRRRIAANAALAGIPAAAVRRSVAESGRMVMETPWLWLRDPARPLGDMIRWQDPQLLDEAVAARRPIVLLTPHMGSFEVAARAYAERHGATQPLTVLYRPARQALLRDLQEAGRVRPHLSTAPANLSGVRLMLRALKRGETIGLLPDQVPPDGQGVWAPFFGPAAYTMTLAARLIQQTGAVPVVLRCERLAAGAGWCVHVPGQYQWGYNRYKQPRGADVEPPAPPPPASAAPGARA